VAAIRSGFYAPGQRLPNIKAIAAELKVSEMSVRNAVRQLADDGEVVGTRTASGSAASNGH